MHQTTLIVFIIFLLRWISVASVIESRTITEKQGRDVILSCRFEYLHERDRVMWSKDGVVLSVNEEISGDRKKYQIKNKYDLLIKKVDDQDSGRYLCQNFDQVLSMNVILTILTQPSKPELQQTNQSLIENSRSIFICSTKGGNPLPTFHWFINQIRINDSLFNVYPNTQQSRSELSLPLEKRFHNGILTCQVHNQALDAPLVASQTLNIQYKPEVTLHHGQNVVSNLNLLVIENDPLTIHCQIQSNPPLTKSITWLKNKVLLPSITSSSITFQTVKRHDDGEYTCLASNTIGQGQSSVHIRVQYSPLVQLNGGGYINENQRLILVCQTESYPSIDSYQWYRNNERLNVNDTTSTLIIEKVSKDDSGTYVCLAKNSLKYANGSSIEKSNQTQTQVMVQYQPKVTTLTPIIATDLYADQIELSCQIDSFPDSKVSWRFNDQIIYPSEKYTIVQNESDSKLIIKRMQSDLDYGLYSCHAVNKLGEHSTTIQLRSKAVPEQPKNVHVKSRTYSSITVQWTPGFDGGWPQRFALGLNHRVWQETNETSFTFTQLQHGQFYNITVRAINLLGQSTDEAFLRVQTENVTIRKEDLPTIEHASIHLSAQTIHYRLNNSSFLTIKVPLCLRIDITNQSSLCPRIVTSSGFFNLDEKDLRNIDNVSLCLDHYEDYCSIAVPVAIKQDASISWIFILIASLTMVSCLILCGLAVFCFIVKRRRRHTVDQNGGGGVTSSTKKSSQHPIVTESTVTNVSSPKQHFSNLTYPEQQPTPSSYSKLADLEKFDRYQGTTTSGNHRQLSSITSGSSDPIVSNPNSSSLCGSDQLTVTDLNPTDISSIQNDLLSVTTPYTSFGFPYYSTTLNPLQSTQDDMIESGYSTPLKSHPLNKKTVYEVVV